jgi:hypothetical protein
MDADLKAARRFTLALGAEDMIEASYALAVLGEFQLDVSSERAAYNTMLNRIFGVSDGPDGKPF